MSPEKSLKCGFKMPVFGMGTWMMGGGEKRNHDNDDLRDINALKSGLACGLRHIDTAEMYAGGFAERIVARAIDSYKREELFITSKVWNTNLKFDDVLRSAEKSLERLNTDYIDLYLVHKPSEDVPLHETIRAMGALKDRGIIRNIGVSNFSVERFQDAQASCDHKIVANQLHYNLIIREVEEKGVLSYCRENDVMLIAWRPIQKGIFASCKDPGLKYVCQKYHKSPVQIALNWLMAQDNIVTMSTMRSISHLKENTGALGWCMSREDISLLKHKFTLCQPVSDAVPIL